MYKHRINGKEWFPVETKREVAMIYAVKLSDLVNGTICYKKARDYAAAWELKKRTDADCEPYWEFGVDFETEVVEVDDDFDFENQSELN